MCVHMCVYVPKDYLPLKNHILHISQDGYYTSITVYLYATIMVYMTKNVQFCTVTNSGHCT